MRASLLCSAYSVKSNGVSLGLIIRLSIKLLFKISSKKSKFTIESQQKSYYRFLDLKIVVKSPCYHVYNLIQLILRWFSQMIQTYFRHQHLPFPHLIHQKMKFLHTIRYIIHYQKITDGMTLLGQSSPEYPNHFKIVKVYLLQFEMILYQ